jgi:carboxymethylenebutenolidase
MGSMIEFDRADGKAKARGYLATTPRAGAPGVVVIQEWWGLQDQIKGICDRLAAAGYHALAPDLYGGVAVPYHDPESANRAMSSLDFIDATDNAVRGAVQYFKRQGLKAGLTGFCMGGAVTIIGAVRIPELDAGVCFYGIPPAQAADPAKIRIPLQGHFANRDDWCTPQAVDTFEAALKAAGIQADLHRYDADHGFVNEQRETVHDAASAALAWQRMLDFWKKHLG